MGFLIILSGRKIYGLRTQLATNYRPLSARAKASTCSSEPRSEELHSGQNQLIMELESAQVEALKMKNPLATVPFSRGAATDEAREERYARPRD